MPSLPLEVIGEIIDSLQDDLPALRSCSQTCLSLLPLCRKHIFRTISLAPQDRLRLSGCITLLGNLLDSNPGVADYVRNLIYYINTPDFEDEAVPRTLRKFHRIQYFRLTGHVDSANWHNFQPAFQQSLSYIISLPSITSLEICSFRVFPINIFIPCINLTELILDEIIESAVMDNSEYENSASYAVPQLQSFTSGTKGGYLKDLVEARRSKDVPVLDFSNLRKLGFDLDEHSHLAAVYELTKVAEKLETLCYSGLYQTYLRLYAGTKC